MKTSNMYIADSSGLISSFVRSDSNHKKAVGWIKKLERSSEIIYIPTEIFAETINIVGKKLNHTIAFELAKALSSSSYFDICESREEVRQNALEKFVIQKESVSFMDCIVMSFADHYETKKIFGFDDCFEKNGYSLF